MAKTQAAPKTRTSTKAKGPRAGDGTGSEPAGKSKQTRLFPSYDAACRHLFSRVNMERARLTREHRGAFKLDRMRALCAALGDPQDAVRCVHIAGTKGKGSTAAMTASCLEGCGYAVGLYTSPHLVDVRERISINREMVTQAEFTRLLDTVVRAATTIEGKHGEATFFELMTAMAFVHFAEKAVDIAVVECGLGGRLDATNVIKPDVAVVTEISFDHTALLGDTLPEIAREKAGIFKASAASITMPQPEGVLEAMREVAEASGAQLEVLGAEIDFSVRFESSADLGPHRRVCVTSERSMYEHLAAPLPGEHQAFNCGLALAALDKLRDRGFNLPEPQVAAGLARTRVAGRMELAWDNPRVLLDVAHNPASLGALMRTIGAHVPYDSMVMIFGCSADKDLDAMLEKVAQGADKVIFAKAEGSPRAAEPRELQRRFAELSPKMTQVASSLDDALRLASRAVSRGDLICITGSFYLVGEAKQRLAELAAKPKRG